MPNESWFKVGAARGAKGVGEIVIYGEIGGWGITAQAFERQLKDLGKLDEIRLRINSDGGDVIQGFAMFNILRRVSNAGTRITVTIDGLAASMASVIAMAGDEVVMPKNAMIMIHNPWGMVTGEADQVIAFGEALDKMEANILEAYRARTGISDKKLRAYMDRETWFDAAEAVKLGFADRVEEPVKMAAKISPRFANFKNAPKDFVAAIENMETQKMSDTDQKPVEKTEADIRAAAVAEMRAADAKIAAVCKLAGFPEAAAKFIAEGKSEADVLTALEGMRAEADKSVKKPGAELNAHRSGSETESADYDFSSALAKFNPAKR